MRAEEEIQALSSRKSSLELPEFFEYEPTQGDSFSQRRGLKLGSAWRFVRRNIFLIGGITALVSGIIAYAVLSQPLLYAGEFQLLVEPMTSQGRRTDPTVLSGSETSSTVEGLDYPTLLRVLKSPSVMAGILQQIQTRYPDLYYDELMKHLDVNRVGDDRNLLDRTRLLSITYEDNDFQKIMFVLQEVSKGYLQFGLDDRRTRIGGGVAFIEEQLPELRQRVNALEGQIQELKQEYRISDPEVAGAALTTQAQQLENQRMETQKELQAQRALYGNLQNQLGLSPQDALAATSLTENPRYQALLTQLKQIETQIASESAQFTDENPVIQTLRDQQRNLTALLNQETQRLVGSRVEAAASAAGGGDAFQNSIQRSLSQQMVEALNNVQVLEVRNQAAAQAAANVDRQLQQFPEIQRRYNDLSRQLEIATTTLNQLLLRRETLQVESAQREVPWQVVSQPGILRDADGNPILPKQDRRRKLALGLLGGFLLGLGAALMKEKQQDRFASIEDVLDATAVPLLGTLPFNDALNVLDTLPTQETGLSSLSVCESQQTFFRSTEDLYTKLRFVGQGASIRSLVVGSAVARDGKTTISLYLARAAASMGQRVLIVDADMTLPQLHVRLGIPNFEGLREVLTENLDPNQLIQRSPYDANLFVLTAGQVASNSHKLLASNQMQYLMEQLQSTFDLVIYDTTHLQGHTDAQFLSLHADGLLLVVGIGKTRRSVFLKRIEELQRNGLPVLGFVANFAGASSNLAQQDLFEGAMADEMEDDLEMFKVTS
ncbi:polysaccharide biosynthesis tyrosine autokinase [Synechococcales cyanobacterium C]|uniref:non-specific protein-tyrosine kinase n=1 Tax=Petrachloros mirabilis ULC683 TaxID=2781853 RepID=A0A8K2A031_9CYAN|nr:tyrosine-protein kinase domain-containing protein [Petrachloros mirabilis]NCJ07258.1 polysaccharide biosynthesis tyrosine autokinase [Petrachloros mirabilis ULC683]